MNEVDKVSAMLSDLRALRDACAPGPIRHYYNAACDRLAVLESQLYSASKKSEMQLVSTLMAARQPDVFTESRGKNIF